MRGGFGIFYDRPQGNMVFDMIANAPGVLVSTVGLGPTPGPDRRRAAIPIRRCRSIPTAFDFKPPKVDQWNVGVQHKLWSNVIFDVAYVGSKSRDLLRQVQINAVPFGATFLAAEPGSDPCAERDAGFDRAAQRLAAAVPGLRQHPDVGLQRVLQLQRPPDVGHPPVRRRVHVLGLLRLEQGARDQQHRLRGRRAEPQRRGDEAARLLVLDYDRTHNFVVNFIYQMPKVATAHWARWRTTGRSRASTGGRAAGPIPSTSRFPASAPRTSPGPMAIRTRASCSPATRAAAGAAIRTGSSTRRASRRRSPAAMARNRRASSSAAAASTTSTCRISKKFRVAKGTRFELRLDMFNALNHTQFTGVNNSVNFASLTDRTVTNLPYDAKGNLVRRNGFGAINGVAPPRTLQLVTRLTF